MPDDLRQAASEFIVNNKVDQVVNDSQRLDGIRGFNDFINQKLKLKSSKLAEADKILDEHLLKGVKKNMPISQKELLANMKKSNLKAGHHLPLTVPEEVKTHLKKSALIKKFKISK